MTENFQNFVEPWKPCRLVRSHSKVENVCDRGPSLSTGVPRKQIHKLYTVNSKEMISTFYTEDLSFMCLKSKNYIYAISIHMLKIFLTCRISASQERHLFFNTSFHCLILFKLLEKHQPHPSVEGCVVDSMDFGTISPPLELFICR
jgi:hypothetical protein